MSAMFCRRCNAKRPRPLTVANNLQGELLRLGGDVPWMMQVQSLEADERYRQLADAVRLSVRAIQADDERLCLDCFNELSKPLPVSG